MKLSSLKLKTFKGAREFELVLNGADISVYGDNATGKTTLADAFYWGLFDKDSTGRTKFEKRTLGEDGKQISSDASVELTFDIDGEETTLTRTYREEISAIRGNPLNTEKGNTTEYLVNGVSKLKKEYDAEVAQICPPALFRLLTDPLFFPVTTEWQDRRKILLKVCGDVMDSEVIESNHKLADLPALMGKKSIEDYRDIVGAERKKAVEELKDIPTRIDEANRSKPTNLSSENVAQRINDFRASVAALESRRAQVSAGGEIAHKQVEATQVENRLLAIAGQMRTNANADRESALLRIRGKESEINDTKRSLRTLDTQISALKADAERLDRTLATKRGEFDQIKTREFTGVLTGVDACPSCGQDLPSDRIQAAKDAFEKQREVFYVQRSADLEANQNEGRAQAGRKKEIARQVSELSADRDALAQRIESLNAEVALIVIPEPGEFDPLSNPEYAQLIDKKGAIRLEIAAMQSDSGATLSRIDAELTAYRADLRAVEEVAAAQVAAVKIDERIKGLKAREKELGGQIEQFDRAIYLIEEFIRAKVRMLTERINTRFSITRFQLFREQVNGGLEECCEPMGQGPDGQWVPYKDLNHGGQINVGLDIINTLAEFNNFAPPIFIDNAESVTSIIPTRGQQIRLIVSAADKKLRVETNYRLQEAA